MCAGRRAVGITDNTDVVSDLEMRVLVLVLGQTGGQIEADTIYSPARYLWRLRGI